MPILVLGVLMAGSRKRPLSSWTLPRGPKRQVPPRVRAVRLAWGLFLFIGVPLGFMAALGPLAYAGIYIEPLRQFWRPWPPDILKSFLAVAGFATTLAYLGYRLGRNAGYLSGAVAAKAKARNVAEGRTAPPEPTEAPTFALVSTNPPAQPPEIPPAPPSP